MHTLISAADLLALQSSSEPAVLLDCGFDLSQPEAGQAQWQQGHLPGATYLHLERELSGPKHDTQGQFLGRHPLPERQALAKVLGNCGIRPDRFVVAYDAQGSCYAARAWWLLRWMGHDNVAVLDGGWQAWREVGGAPESTKPKPSAAPAYPSGEPAMPTVQASTLQNQLGHSRLIDARAAERFRGEVEPLDAAAGHIPGARNRFFKDNLQPSGHFKPAERLRTEWLPLIAGQSPVHYCGSGVTACHNILAAAHAGLGVGALYPGSWSEWSSQAHRPQAKG
jgi:thiosulfate/3-mercaptopyruvate sulfurtransferase